MNDETKAAVERFRSIIEKERAQMDAETFAALWGSDAVVLAHIAGEPERIAAKAEEVREACALHLARVWYGLPDGGVAALGTVACVRTTPLDARPLADRIAELEAELSKSEWRVAELEDDVADARILLEPHFGQETYQLPLAKTTAGLIARAEKAEARVEELEQQKDDLKTMIQDLRERAEKAERLADQLCAVLGREVGNRGDSEGAVDVAERLIRERDEAVAALRLVRDWTEPYRGAPPMTTDELHNHVLAVLAKYPEAKR